MGEHRWTIPCELDPERAELDLADAIEQAAGDGWAVIKHVETVGFFGWTLRAPDERAVGVSVPQPGGPERLMVRSDHPELAEQVLEALTAQGPLEGREVRQLRDG